LTKSGFSLMASCALVGVYAPSMMGRWAAWEMATSSGLQIGVTMIPPLRQSPCGSSRIDDGSTTTSERPSTFLARLREIATSALGVVIVISVALIPPAIKASNIGTTWVSC